MKSLIVLFEYEKWFSKNLEFNLNNLQVKPVHVELLNTIEYAYMKKDYRFVLDLCIRYNDLNDLSQPKLKLREVKEIASRSAYKLEEYELAYTFMDYAMVFPKFILHLHANIYSNQPMTSKSRIGMNLDLFYMELKSALKRKDIVKH